jgi:Mu transposase, C-terminal domain
MSEFREHAGIGRALYSAPQQYPGAHLDARADSALVKLFHRGQLVKTHPRQQPGRRSTDPADLPAEKTIYAMRTSPASRRWPAGAWRYLILWPYPKA